MPKKLKILKNIKMILAVMGLENIRKLKKEHLLLVDENGYIHHDIKRYLDKKYTEDEEMKLEEAALV